MRKLLLYCTKAKPYLIKVGKYGNGTNYYESIGDYSIASSYNILNGKIIAECDYEVEEIKTYYNNQIFEGCRVHTINTYNISKLLELSCLNQKQLDDYLGENNGYAIHIKNLHIFDKPRELNYYNNGKHLMCVNEDAPQNMKKVYEYIGGDNFNEYVLISIQPQWLCKILNGKKTIEVRKKVLKEMII